MCRHRIDCMTTRKRSVFTVAIQPAMQDIDCSVDACYSAILEDIYSAVRQRRARIPSSGPAGVLSMCRAWTDRSEYARSTETLPSRKHRSERERPERPLSVHRIATPGRKRRRDCSTAASPLTTHVACSGAHIRVAAPSAHTAPCRAAIGQTLCARVPGLGLRGSRVGNRGWEPDVRVPRRTGFVVSIPTCGGRGRAGANEDME